ncbi:M56 family metallopeptidase [Siphonobacter sp. SORGH_AS_0500]|uniref:M56 family metallopeptidase n=1 Tax=Siphonobacter sp. SORGH_AS_0500 TaxID=1864824 RepID=UPI002860D802|nr:M56 family metallopeptidase [Siphonobacter sp. SORGH_AS_0500]MDR6194206.1 bla regulator protein BlaR1 [Siphonobacter sp. SORGH_AS_0500]
MEYLLKSILCSFIFLVVYQVLLEREKMFVFNRFYLLLSLAGSLLIPFITFQLPEAVIPSASENLGGVAGYHTDLTQTNQTTVSADSGFEIDWRIGYGIVTVVLLARFMKSLLTIGYVKNSNVIVQDSIRIVLLPKETLPYSFLNYIFVNKKAYDNHTIEPEIWRHEFAHVRQKHTLDILFIELILVFWWFNPCVYLYRKNIKMNHEFLADEAVLVAYPEVKNYQRLLLSKVSQRVSFTSAFNYAITKKRLQMMTRMTSRFRTFVIQLSVLPVLGIAVALFSSVEYAEAQTAPTMVRPDTDGVTKSQNPASKEGVSDDLLKEYQSIVDRSWVKGKNGYEIRHFSETDRARMKSIFDQMSQQQRNSQEIVVKYIPPFPQTPYPTQKQLDSWKNPKMNGVWIDGKRVSNEILNKYKPEDFAVVSVSKLEKNAINYGKHYYQVDLMTNKDYKKYLKETEKEPNYTLYANNGDWTRKGKK